MTLTNPSLELVFVGSSTIPDTTVSNSDIVRQSVQIEWQMMNDLKSTSDKAKISIAKNSPAVSRIMSFDGDIRATLKDGSTTLFTGFLSNKYKWSVTNHGEQVLALTIEDNTRLLETIFSDKDRLINEAFYLPATGSRATASGLLVELAAVCGFTILGTVPEIDTNIIKLIDADTECVDILDQVCFELGYCYKFNALGQLYLWQIAVEDEAVSATLNKDSLYAVNENAVIVNKSLKQYNRAIVKYTDIATRTDALVYQDISGQNSTHPYCYITVQPGMAYPSGLTIAGHTDDQLKGICDVSDLDEGKTVIGIGDTITTEFECTSSAITCSIQKYSATQVSVLVKNTGATPIYILKLRAKATITYKKGDSKVYAGSVSDKKYYETELEYTHDDDTATDLGNLIYQFYKHSNLSYQFYSKTQLALGSIIQLNENQHSGISAKLMVNARVDSSSTDVYQYVAYSFSPFNLEESTTSESRTYSPEGIAPTKTLIQYALGSSPDSPPGSNILGVDTDEELGSDTDKVFAAQGTEWSYDSPSEVPTGKYVWMRTSTDSGSTWAYSRLTGEQGADGGEYGYELVVSGSTFYQNRRATGNQPPIPVYTVITGYTNATSTISTSVTPEVYSGGNLNIPYNNQYNEITVTAVLTVSGVTLETRTHTLKPIDITEAPQFLGCIAGTDAPPDETSSGENLIAGDHFCVSSTYGSYTKGDCYRYTETGWIKLDASNGTPTEFLNCLNGFQKADVELSSISDSDAISWFNSIVANKVIARSIWGQIGEFDELTINKKAVFEGTLSGTYLKTTNAVTTETIYNASSDETSGPSKFLWSDIQDAYEDYYDSEHYGDLLTASGTINGKTASKVVYHTSSSLADTFETIKSASWGTATQQIINVTTAICPTVYRITVQLNSLGFFGRSIAYRIVHSDSTSEDYTIISGDGVSATTIKTKELHSGDTLKLIGKTVSGEPYSVQLYHSDNYGVGTNVITSDGYKYNVNGTLPVSTYSASLTGTGTTKPTLVVEEDEWDVDDVATVKAFAGQTGTHDAPSTGTAILPPTDPTITSIGTATVRFRGGSNTQYTLKSASWGSTSITFTSTSGTSVTISESTADLEYWYIHFTVYVVAGGVVSQGLQPWSDSSYNIGANDNRWQNGYFDNLYSDSLSASNVTGSAITASTNFLGQLGNANNKSNAFVNVLTVNSLSGISYLDPTAIKKRSTGFTGSTTVCSISAYELSVGQLAIEAFHYNDYTRSITVNFSGSGTYSYVYVSTSSSCNSLTGSVAKAGDASSSEPISASFTSSSAGGVGFVVYWRTA